MKLNEILKGTKFDKIIVLTRDRDSNLFNLLNHIKSLGNIGHSFTIVVDPDNKEGKTFSWDGDGSDFIKSIEREKGNET